MGLTRKILEAVDGAEAALESFSTQRDRFVDQGAGKDEVLAAFASFKGLKKKGLLSGAEKDIDTYKTLADVLAVVKSKEGQQTKTQAKKAVKTEGAELVWEDDAYLIYRVDTKEASCLYGKGTKWCISGDVNNMFTRYKRLGHTTYMAVPKPDAPYPKLAVVIEDDSVLMPAISVYDADDDVKDYIPAVLKAPKEAGVFKHVEYPPEKTTVDELTDVLLKHGWAEDEREEISEGLMTYIWLRRQDRSAGILTFTEVGEAGPGGWHGAGVLTEIMFSPPGSGGIEDGDFFIDDAEDLDRVLSKLID